MKTYLSRLIKFNYLNGFRQDEKGSVAIMAALAIPALLLLSAIAIETSRVNYVDAKLAQAVDAAAIAGGRYKLDEIQMNALKVFDANFPPGTMGMYPDPNISYDEETKIVHVDVTDSLPTLLGRAVGVNNLTVGAEAEAQREIGGLELAMVLDITGSMAFGNKIGALRIAAEEVVNTIFEDENSKEDIAIGIVPYAAMMNIGTNNTAWLTDPASVTDPLKFTGATPWKGCIKVGNTGEFGDEAIDTPPPAQKWPTYFAETTIPDPADSTNRDNDWRYDGGGNLQILTQIPDGPGGRDRVTVGPNRSCVDPMVPMVSDAAKLRTIIRNFGPIYGGGTTIPLGMIWGARMLSPSWDGLWNVRQLDGSMISSVPIKPYSSAKSVKAMILMTDGVNQWHDGGFAPSTGDPHAYGTAPNDRFVSGKMGASSRGEFITKMNQKLARQCEAAKANGIEVFTVAFQVSDTNIRNILRDCATNEAHFAPAESNDELIEVFRNIAKQLLRIYIVK